MSDSIDDRAEQVQKRIDRMVKEGSPLWRGTVDDKHEVHSLLLSANLLIHDLRLALRQSKRV
jgi:hypothetical protein